MAAITLELEQAEQGALARFAESLGVTPTDVAYAALNHLMMRCEDPGLQLDIVETRNWRRDHLPLWSDSACAAYAYDRSLVDEPLPSRLFNGHIGRVSPG